MWQVSRSVEDMATAENDLALPLEKLAADGARSRIVTSCPRLRFDKAVSVENTRYKGTCIMENTLITYF